MQVARDSRGMRELKKREEKTFEERELKRQGREKRKTLERGESPERQPKHSGILEIFKESAGVPVRASLHPLLLSLSRLTPLPPSPFRAVFRLKLRKHEEGRRGDAMDSVARIHRLLDVLSSPLLLFSQFIDTSRGRSKKEY